MSVQQKKWPGISVSDEDRRIIDRIIKQDGILKSMPMKDLLLLAASIAVKKTAPPVFETNSGTNQIVHPTLLNDRDYREYRQYIALIFYMTSGNKQLNNMSDTTVMVKSFIDYAQRGLRILEVDYLENKASSDNMVNELIELLIGHRKISTEA